LLTTSAWARADCGEEEFTLNASSTVTAKKLDQSTEWSISPVEWQPAALITVDLTGKHWPDSQI